VLAVVHHEQQLPPGERVGHGLDQRGVAPWGDAENGRDGGRHGLRVAQRREIDQPDAVREVGAQPVGEDLIHRHPAAQAPQPVLAERSERHTVTDQDLGRVRDEHLSAVGDRHQTRGSIHLGAEVVPVPLDRLAGVQTHAHCEVDGRVVAQLGLRLDRGRHSIGRGREGHPEAVAAGAKHEPVVPVDRAPHDGVVDTQRVGHVGRVLVPPTGGVLDVGEHEGDGSARASSRHISTNGHWSAIRTGRSSVAGTRAARAEMTSGLQRSPPIVRVVQMLVYDRRRVPRVRATQRLLRNAGSFATKSGWRRPMISSKQPHQRPGRSATDRPGRHHPWCTDDPDVGQVPSAGAISRTAP
jgi:hypothetical protein